MNRAIRIVLGIQLLLAAIWTLATLATGPNDWGILLVFLLVFGAHIPFFLFAAWTFWKHPALRRAAGWAMAIPFASLGVSIVLRQLIGGALSEATLFGLLASIAIGALLYAVVRPSTAMRVIPGGLVKSRGLNWLLVVLQVLGWLFPVAVILYIAAENSGKSMSTTDSTGMGLAYAVVFAAIYFAGVGLFSLLVGVYGWLGLRGKVESPHRRLHITQLVLATPGLLIGVASVLLLIGAS